MINGRGPMRVNVNLAEQLPELRAQWLAQKLDGASFAALVFLHWQIHTYGTRFASRSRLSQLKPDARIWLSQVRANGNESLRKSLVEWLENFQYTGVRASVGLALVGWLRDRWRLVVCEHVPTAQEVLGFLCHAERPVTVICDPSRLDAPVADKPNPFVFLTHDLEHAHRLFHDERLCRLQVGMARILKAAISRGLFQLFDGDEDFTGRFDYLIGDMNTHPFHGLFYLRANMRDYFLRAETNPVHKPLSPTVMGRLMEIFGLIAEVGGFDKEGHCAMQRIAEGHTDSGTVQSIESNLLRIACS